MLHSYLLPSFAQTPCRSKPKYLQVSPLPGRGTISAQTGTQTAVKTPVAHLETRLPRLLKELGRGSVVSE